MAKKTDHKEKVAMKTITIALIGAGQRGENYGAYALKHPYEVQFVAVAEPNPKRRARFQAQHDIPAERCFTNWQELLQHPPLADAMLICTQDSLHFAPAMAALDAGYHVLLEKPMSPRPEECVAMGKRAEELQRIFLICHVLRYTNFFATIKQLLDAGEIGQLLSIQHNENVAFWHYAHSYVRGNWRNTRESSPMILAKSCHDMDILLWLVGADCTHIASFGSLTHFTAKNAPAGAPQRCLDGCPVANTCPYYAPKFYMTGESGWPVSVISDDISMEAVLKVLQEGPYGRCVYYCDNDVVDHQVVNLAFANEVTAAFTMCAFTDDVSRTIKLMGTKGEIRGKVNRDKSELEVIDFSSRTQKVITLQSEGGPQGHGGGDFGVMRNFVNMVRTNDQYHGLTSAAISVQSHLMAFAAEEARLTKTVVSLPEFHQKLMSCPSE
jgi:predicted dehydrogenase